MPQDLFQYEKMVENALRGVVRDAVRRAARDGLRGAHHFYIAFSTTMPGVEIPDSLRAKFPAEMTIVLQHQFWELEVREESFSVTLSFQKQLEQLTVPFAAIRTFADPSVNFALEFAAPAEASAERPAALPAAVKPAPEPRDQPQASQAQAPSKSEGAEVVALDKFRKR